MSPLLTYLFYPNPGAAAYGDPWVIAVLVLCAALVAGAIAVRRWRAHLENAVTKKLSRTWSAALFWFGCVGFVLTIARVEKIQFVAMRFLWVLWVIGLLLYVVAQVRIFRMRHYAVLPRVTREDPRAKYLPGRKK